MGKNDFYSESLDVIQQIPDERILYPDSIPVSFYIFEAENLYDSCQQDRTRLTADGLCWSIVDDLPLRIFLLRESQSRWTDIDSYDIKSFINIDDKCVKSYELKRRLLRSLLFTFRNNPGAVKKIKDTCIESRTSAIIDSLKEILSSENDLSGQELNEKTNNASIDHNLLRSCEMTSLLSAICSGVVFCNSKFKTRNQAYTHLKEAVDEIRCHAHSVFRDEPWRLKNYISEYTTRRIH